jgi:hypothetical protein
VHDWRRCCLASWRRVLGSRLFLLLCTCHPRFSGPLQASVMIDVRGCLCKYDTRDPLVIEESSAISESLLLMPRKPGSGGR